MPVSLIVLLVLCWYVCLSLLMWMSYVCSRHRASFNGHCYTWLMAIKMHWTELNWRELSAETSVGTGVCELHVWAHTAPTTGKGSLLNRPSCPPDNPIGEGTELSRVEHQRTSEQVEYEQKRVLFERTNERTNKQTNNLPWLSICLQDQYFLFGYSCLPFINILLFRNKYCFKNTMKTKHSRSYLCLFRRFYEL